jgi:hypothetical protein
MNLNDIVIELDAEIARLQLAKALLIGINPIGTRKRGRPAAAALPGKATSFNPADFAEKPKKRRTMSAAGRERIAAAQRARWAKSKKANKKAAPAKRAARKIAAPKAVTAKKAPVPNKATSTTPAS